MARDFHRLIAPLIAPLKTRIANLVSRAVVQRVDDSDGMQLVQVAVLDTETRDEVERVQNYGFTAVPLADAEAVVLFVGGRRDHGLAVAVDDRRYRLTGLQPGEVALYDKNGTTVILKTNGDVEITPASGLMKVIGDVVADTISLKNHVHPPGPGEVAGPYPVVGNTSKPI